MQRIAVGILAITAVMTLPSHGLQNLGLTASATTNRAAVPSPTPNLSGTWILNITKSDFGQIPPPTSQTDTIEHNEPSLKITVDQKGGAMGDATYTTALSTDGKETTSTGMGGAEVKSTAHWDRDALVVVSKTSFQGSDLTIKDTYSLSTDSKVLTQVTHVESSMGNFDAKDIFDKH